MNPSRFVHSGGAYQTTSTFVPGDKVIYDEPGELIRRYGSRGWKMVARDNNGAPCNILHHFFDRHHGDWKVWEETCSGSNAISWETHGDVVHIWNQYTNEKAKILRTTLLTVIGNMRSWMGLPPLADNPLVGAFITTTTTVDES